MKESEAAHRGKSVQDREAPGIVGGRNVQRPLEAWHIVGTIVGSYVFFAGLWILLSDRLLAFLARDPQIVTKWSIYKGLAFVVITGILLCVLILNWVYRLRCARRSLEESEQKYRILVENANSIILHWTHDGQITFLNEYGQRFFGYSETEIIGQHVVGTILPESETTGRDVRPLMDRISADPSAFEHNVSENVRRTGEKGWIAWTNKVAFDDQGRVEGILSIGTDVTEHKRAEREAARTRRALFTLSQVNQAQVHAAGEDELLQEVCRILHEDGGYHLAWIGYRMDDPGRTVKPVAQTGFEEGYLEGAAITWADAERGRGPTGTAIRTGLPAICQDLSSDPDFLPWRETAARRGYASSLALPLNRDGTAFGALMVYATECDAFDTAEVKLLTELANDLAYGITAMRTRVEHARAEDARQTAYRLLENIIEFLPDATFVIDHEKRVIAWNRACEIMTGVKKESVLGLGDCAYAEPFVGEQHPMLVDLLEAPPQKSGAFHKYVRRVDDTLYAESFIPGLRDGQGAHLWGAARMLFDQQGRHCGAIEIIRDVTDEKRVEQALQDSELKYRTLFETAADAILLMRGTHFVDCNARTLAMFRCSREQILDTPPFDFSPPTQPDGRQSDDSAMEKIDQALAGRPQLFEWEHCRWDRTQFTAEVSLNRLELGGEVFLHAVVRDVSERKRAELALRDSEARYHGLFEDCPTSLWEEDFSAVKTYIDGLRRSGIMDLHAHFKNHPDILRQCADTVKVLDVNRATLELLRYERREDLCAHLSQVFLEDSYALFQKELVFLASGNTVFQAETMNHTRLGEKLHVNMTVAIVPGHEETWSRVFVSLTDISPRVRAEEELRTLNALLETRVEARTAELALAKERAESADRLKSTFLAAMSHELRTPLNSIIGFTGIVLQGLPGPLNGEQTKQLSMVQGSARHLLDLINDVLDLSKIEAGQLEVDAKPFNVPESVEKVLHSVMPLADKRGLTLSADVSPDVGELISDRRRFEQVLINLISNGLKFTADGGVRLACLIEGQNLVTRVADTGIGVKPEDMGKLFHAFQQVDVGLTRNHEGTGLGLSICKRLVEKMGGRIWAESEWGVGSVFTFTLPLVRN